ncbi:MAG TPA: response regulator [Polyangiaceae bacterium]|jgi:CheY-like chemotaxis protein|nr:response regulator [Polyangiaceae bacterium]
MAHTSKNQVPTVLVVDDSEVVLSVTKTLLEAAGYRVLTHPGPAGCVAVILQEKPDLVLIDVNMPKLGGETIVKLFGKAQPNSETITLLFSTLPADQLESRAQSSGAHGYIRKTEDPFELLRHVNRWLGTKGLAAPARPPSGSVEARSARGPASTPQSGERRRPKSARPGSAATLPAMSRVSRPNMAASGTTRLVPTVLFIDEEMEALSAYRRDVQGEPYRADFALSAQQALRHIASGERPDLIVASLEPSGIDVYERAVGSDALWRDRFVFIISTSRSDRAKAFLAKFGGVVLRRPVDAAQLRLALRGLLTGESEQRSQEG